MEQTLTGLFGAPCAVVPCTSFPSSWAPLKAKNPKIAVELSDSAYVVCSMRIMATIQVDVLAKLNETNGFFVKALHSVGAP